MASYAENVSIWWRYHDPHHHNHANGVSHRLDDHRLRLWKLRLMRTLRRRWGDLGRVFARNCLSIYGSVSMVLYLHVWKQRTYSNESSTLQLVVYFALETGRRLCIGHAGLFSNLQLKLYCRSLNMLHRFNMSSAYFYYDSFGKLAICRATSPNPFNYFTYIS